MRCRRQGAQWKGPAWNHYLFSMILICSWKTLKSAACSFFFWCKEALSSQGLKLDKTASEIGNRSELEMIPGCNRHALLSFTTSRIIRSAMDFFLTQRGSAGSQILFEDYQAFIACNKLRCNSWPRGKKPFIEQMEAMMDRQCIFMKASMSEDFMAQMTVEQPSNSTWSVWHHAAANVWTNELERMKPRSAASDFLINCSWCWPED